MEVKVKITPTQSERIGDEIARAKETVDYSGVVVGTTVLRGSPSALRSIADGLESTFSEDDEIMRISDKVSNKGRELTEAREAFGVARARESVEHLVKNLRTAAYGTLTNRAMARCLEDGEAIDLAQYRQEDGTYLLPADLDLDGKDLCDATVGVENWVWSVGRNKKTGERRAALDERYYLNENWICEWLR